MGMSVYSLNAVRAVNVAREFKIWFAVDLRNENGFGKHTVPNPPRAIWDIH